MKTLDVKTNYRTYKECFLRVEDTGMMEAFH